MCLVVLLLKFICNVTCSQVLPCQKGPRCKPVGKWKTRGWVLGTKMETSPSLCFHKCKHPFREPEISTAEQRTQQPKESSILDIKKKQTKRWGIPRAWTLMRGTRTKVEKPPTAMGWGLGTVNLLFRCTVCRDQQLQDLHLASRCWWLCLVRSKVLCRFQHRPRCLSFLQQVSASKHPTWDEQPPKTPFPSPPLHSHNPCSSETVAALANAGWGEEVAVSRCCTMSRRWWERSGRARSWAGCR